MATEAEQLQSWCECDFALPPQKVTDKVLTEMLGCHLSPIMLRALLAKTTPTQLVIRGNVLGPQHYASALLRAKFSRLRPECTKLEEPPAGFVQVESKCPEWSSDIDWSEPVSLKNGFLVETYPGSLNWVALPLVLCGWGALLAAVTLFNWV